MNDGSILGMKIGDGRVLISCVQGCVKIETEVEGVTMTYILDPTSALELAAIISRQADAAVDKATNECLTLSTARR